MTDPGPDAAYVLDASMLIAHLNAHDEHHRAATTFLRDNAGARLWMSTLNVAEVLVGYARAHRMAEGRQTLADLGITERALPDEAAGRLATLRHESGLKMPDCCVLLTAEQTGSPIASFDDRLRREATRAGLAVITQQ